MGVGRQYPDTDIVIRGDATVAAAAIAGGASLSDIPGISYRNQGRVVENADRSPLAEPDALPFPARDLTRNALYIRPDTGRPQTTIQAGWGCPFSCTYCLAPLVSGRRLKLRSPASIVAEIEECLCDHGIRDFYFRADTFTLQKSWVMELCTSLVQRGLDVAWGCNSRVDTVDAEMLAAMRRAGCWIVGFGVESGSDEILARIKKGATVDQARRAIHLCCAAGIRAYAFFMVGFPGETEVTARATLDLIRTIGADFIEMNVPVPFPGTPLATECERAELLAASLLGHDHSRPVIRPHAMSRRRVEEIWRLGYRAFYARPGHAWHLLRQAGSLHTATRYLTWGVGFFARVIHHRLTRLTPQVPTRRRTTRSHGSPR